MKHQEFFANAQGIVDYTVPVFAVNNDMVIATEEGAVYITKEQAMKFFNLVDAPVPIEKKCCVCGTKDNLYNDGWYGYRCTSPDCIVF